MAGSEAGKLIDQDSKNVETDISAPETDISAPSQVSECAAMGISTQTSSNSVRDDDRDLGTTFTPESTGTLHIFLYGYAVCFIETEDEM